MARTSIARILELHIRSPRLIYRIFYTIWLEQKFIARRANCPFEFEPIRVDCTYIKNVYFKIRNVFLSSEQEYFLLRGHEGTVRKVYTEILILILEQKNTCNVKTATNDINRSTQDFITSMLDSEPEAPKYWKNYKRGCRLTSLMVSAKHFVTSSKFELEELRKNSHAFSTIVRMINATFDYRSLGKGKDAEGLGDFTYKKLFVLKIERIENLDLYEQFFRKRQALYRRLYKSGEITYPKLEGHRKCTGGVLTAGHIHPALDQDIHSGINEHMFFHGTKLENVTTICNDGLDPRLSHEDSMHGRGIYAAECATKADQYAGKKSRLKVTWQCIKQIELSE